MNIALHVLVIIVILAGIVGAAVGLYRAYNLEGSGGRKTVAISLVSLTAVLIAVIFYFAVLAS